MWYNRRRTASDAGDPWGSIAADRGAAPARYQYTGQEHDSTGLYDYHARMYDPVLGRFLSADTIVPSPANPQSLNRYAYTLNNPLRYTDPTGHMQSCGSGYDECGLSSSNPGQDIWTYFANYGSHPGIFQDAYANLYAAHQVYIQGDLTWAAHAQATESAFAAAHQRLPQTSYNYSHGYAPLPEWMSVAIGETIVGVVKDAQGERRAEIAGEIPLEIRSPNYYDRLKKTFEDYKGKQWFGRTVYESTDLVEWDRVVRQATRSSKTFD